MEAFVDAWPDDPIVQQLVAQIALGITCGYDKVSSGEEDADFRFADTFARLTDGG